SSTSIPSATACRTLSSRSACPTWLWVIGSALPRIWRPWSRHFPRARSQPWLRPRWTRSTRAPPARRLGKQASPIRSALLLPGTPKGLAARELHIRYLHRTLTLHARYLSLEGEIGANGNPLREKGMKMQFQLNKAGYLFLALLLF